jgi:protein TonB
MKTTSFASKSLDDLVFENRNKDYGAYVIRRSYDENVNRAFFLTMLAGLFLAACAFVISSMDGEVTGKKKTPVGPMTYEPSPKPEIIPEPRQLVSRVKQVSANLVPLVTTDVVDDVIIPDEITTPVGSIDGSDDGPVDFTTTGTGTGTIAITEAVVKPPTIFITVGKMPEYIGGVKEMNIFLQRKLRYPGAAARIGTEGTVYVSFVIDADGKVILPEILRGLSRECDAEAIRVISQMPAWLAGKQNNVPVMVRMVLPIKFQLNSNS